LVHLINTDALLRLYWQAIRGKHFLNGKPFTVDKLLHEINELDMLILNEVGVKTYNEYESGFLNNVISQIYDNEKCLGIVSNEPFTNTDGSERSVSSILGDRVMSRAAECGYQRLAFNWRDYRQMSCPVSVEAA